MVKELAEAFRLHQDGRLDAAEVAYAKVLSAHPDDPVALINAGALALARDDLDGAVTRLSRAVTLVPRNAVAQNNLGFALVRAGRLAEALGALDRAVALQANYALAHNNRGIAFVRLGRRDDAAAAFERALALAPDLTDAAVNLGDIHAERGDAHAAAEIYERALQFQPANPAARAGRAFAAALSGDLEDARRQLETLVADVPQHAPSWQTLGAVLNWSWEHASAEAAFTRALALSPDSRDAQFGIASSLLGRGCYREGFAAFEHRTEGLLDRETRLPQYPSWSGGRMAGTLLIYAEQGFGDVVQCVRFVAATRERVDRVVVLADGYWKPLAPLLATAAGVDRVVTDVDSLAGETVGARVSMLSLPYVLSIEAGVLPGVVPYLRAPGHEADRWQANLASMRPPRVGLAWSVQARDAHGFVTRHKSIPADALATLLTVPDVRFTSLQPGVAGDPNAFGVLAPHVAGWGAELGDFGATAALIDALDLVITADTAVAHVAGALGRDVWLIDRFNGCWRWRVADETSPWYPTMKIFRQDRFGDWSGVLQRVRARLDEWRRLRPDTASRPRAPRVETG